MVFERNIFSNEKKKEVSGMLQVAVKAIPAFSIEGSASINFTEAEDIKRNSITFRFHGDAVIDPPPATYEDAIKVWAKNH